MNTVKAYLEITLKIDEANRPAAAKVYTDYRGPFLDTIEGALTKDLLIRAFSSPWICYPTAPSLSVRFHKPHCRLSNSSASRLSKV